MRLSAMTLSILAGLGDAQAKRAIRAMALDVAEGRAMRGAYAVMGAVWTAR